jgi:hypothetical protein
VGIRCDLVGGAFSGVVVGTGGSSWGTAEIDGGGFGATGWDAACCYGGLRVVCGCNGLRCCGAGRCFRTGVDDGGACFVCLSRICGGFVRAQCVLCERVFGWDCCVRFAVSKTGEIGLDRQREEPASEGGRYNRQTQEPTCNGGMWDTLENRRPTLCAKGAQRVGHPRIFDGGKTRWLADLKFGHYMRRGARNCGYLGRRWDFRWS